MKDKKLAAGSVLGLRVQVLLTGGSFFDEFFLL